MIRRLLAQNDRTSGGDITGFFSPDEPGLCVPVPVRRPLSLGWVSDELIAETQRLWSARYERTISAEEAIEILQNVKRFAEMLLETSVSKSERSATNGSGESTTER